MSRALGGHSRRFGASKRIPARAVAGAWVEDKIPGIEDPFIQSWMIDLADDHYELDISRARTLLGWEPYMAGFSLATLALHAAAIAIGAANGAAALGALWGATARRDRA
jgi:hypothetical protein